WENVALPLVFRGESRAARRRLSLEVLDSVGLATRSGHRPSQMSGGEQQRVAIARALAGNPPLLLCDEPTGNLDTATSAQIMDLLARAHSRGAALVMVTHDPDLAVRHAQRTIR